VLPVQLYETAIYDRETEAGVRFVTIPVRSLDPSAFIPGAIPAAELLHLLGFETWQQLDSVEPWSLPFLIDSTLDRPPHEHSYFDPTPEPGVRPPSPLAQYVAYSAVVPFEESPLSNQSLSALVSGPAQVSAAVGWYTTGDPMILFMVAGAIIVVGAARGVARALEVGLEIGLLRLMGIGARQRRDEEGEADGDEDGG
jgi:hypothetical protein